MSMNNKRIVFFSFSLSSDKANKLPFTTNGFFQKARTVTSVPQSFQCTNVA